MPSLRRAATVLLVLGALVLSACASEQDALRAGGQVLTTAELFDLLEAQPGGGASGSPASFETAAAAEVLSQKAYEFIIVDELERRGIPITDADRAFIDQALAQQGGAAVGDLEVAAYLLGGALAAERGPGAERAAVEDAVFAQLAAGASQPAQVCLHVLLVAVGELDPETGQPLGEPTEADRDAARSAAAAAQERIVGGEEFEAVAAEVSDLPASSVPGGDLGCRELSQFTESAPADIARAIGEGAIGEASDPIETAEGFYVFRVDERTDGVGPPTRDEYLRDPANAESFARQVDLTYGQRLLQEWAALYGPSAEVWVNPRFGSWDPSQGGVVPPEGAVAPVSPLDLTPGLSGQLTP